MKNFWNDLWMSFVNPILMGIATMIVFACISVIIDTIR